MSIDDVNRAAFLAERRIELLNKEQHALESVTFAQRHLDSVRMEIVKATEELEALKRGQHIVHEVVAE